MGREAALYKVVAAFTTEQFQCQTVKQQVGTRLGRVDIIGLREVQGDLATGYEIISVEVKEEKAPFLPALGQAYAYSIYAHHCYLAVKKRRNSKFTSEEMQIATRFGVGLIEIKANSCQVVLSSRQHVPEERYVLQLIEAMRLFRCVLCHGIYPRTEMTAINQRGPIDLQEQPKYRGQLSRAITQRQNVTYWLYELAKMRGDRRTYTYDRRYLCKDCVSLFASLALAQKDIRAYLKNPIYWYTEV